jgi:starch phosphorylase
VSVAARALPPELAALSALALDLRWTWSHAADALWRAVDADAWERTRNPWFILQSVPTRRLEELARDDAFRSELAKLEDERDAYSSRPPHPSVALDDTAAYFSMEFAIGEAVPLYAGGLGVLAGDYLKTASDLGMPLVGVGLLFHEGYFRQQLDNQGRQHEAYPYNDPTSLPLEPVASSSGGWLRVALDLPGRRLWLRVWRARVGRVSLYLLDSNDPFNTPSDRGITSKLYGGDGETRLLQEIVLGIGGWRTLLQLGVAPAVLHLNEGHAALALVERLRNACIEQRLGFDEALWATRAGNLFTTHTPVEAGFDRFPAELIERYFPTGGDYLGGLGITTAELLALGRRDAGNRDEPFNMAYLAARGSLFVNGVSALHAKVSRTIFSPLLPRWPHAELPIAHVTNGVHVPSWDSAAADALWTRASGKERWLGDDAMAPAFSDEELWSLRAAGRRALCASARARLVQQLARRGASAGERAAAPSALDPDALTLGFARRFAAYKRPTLLLHDRERLARLLCDPARPVQIVVAGKAHPADEPGKRLIEEWLAFVKQVDVRRHAVFLEDYDLELAEELVQGVDVWINTPRRPMEACGTSGMKVLVNGGLNISTLDGWWAEAFTPEVGWQIGDGVEDGDSDARDAEELYTLLERAVVPEFFDRDGDGVPRRWTARMRASMTRLAPRFGGSRMAGDYVARFYRPAAIAARARLADGARRARALASWARELTAHWDEIEISEITARSDDDQLRFELTIALGAVNPDALRVELYAEGGERAIALAPLDAVDGTQRYGATLTTRRPASDFTARVVPRHPDARLPSELPLVHWQR